MQDNSTQTFGGVCGRALGAAKPKQNLIDMADYEHNLSVKFNEAKDKIPYDRLMNAYDRQTLYGDVMDWCRDYFNEPKDPMLAYMLVGYYFTNKQIEKREK